MRKWFIRFVTLYVFDVAALFLIGLLFPRVHVGLSAFWAGLLLAAATLWIKPLITSMFTSLANRSGTERSKFGDWLVRTLVVLAVAFVIWVLVVWLSGVRVDGWVWGYVWPPLALLLVWWIYDALDDTLEARANKIYDSATARLAGSGAEQPTTTAVPTAKSDSAAAQEAKDGLTPQQRKMLDDLDS